MVVVLVEPYASVLSSAYWKRLFCCRFQLTVEVFDYLDAELRLADTGEKQNSALSFLWLTFSMTGNSSFFLEPLPADIAYSCSKARNRWRGSQSGTLFLPQTGTKKKTSWFPTPLFSCLGKFELKRKCLQLEIVKMIYFSMTEVPGWHSNKIKIFFYFEQSLLLVIDVTALFFSVISLKKLKSWLYNLQLIHEHVGRIKKIWPHFQNGQKCSTCLPSQDWLSH